MAEEKNTAPVEEEASNGLDLGVLMHDMVRGFLKYWYIVLALVLVLGLKGMYDSAQRNEALRRNPRKIVCPKKVGIVPLLFFCACFDAFFERSQRYEHR